MVNLLQSAPKLQKGRLSARRSPSAPLNACHSERSEESPHFGRHSAPLNTWHSERSEESPHFALGSSSGLQPAVNKPDNKRALAPGLPISSAPPTSNLEPETSNLENGFTLLELLIVMMIIATLAAIAIPSYTRNVQAAKEAVLREDLQVMRTAIGSYTVDKQKAPQALEDVVTGGYLKAIPKDPVTGRADSWVTSQSDTLNSIDQTDSGGIDDIHSGAQATAIDGTSYNTW